MFRELKPTQTEINRDMPKKNVQIKAKFVTSVMGCGQQ